MQISVCYTGRLKENGQVFVTNIGTSPLKFHLGGTFIWRRLVYKRYNNAFIYLYILHFCICW